jgi:hypothetical protein
MNCATWQSLVRKDRIPQPFFDLFLLLWPGDWKKQLAQLNEAIAKDFAAKSKNKVGVRRIKPISESEFLVLLSYLVP